MEISLPLFTAVFMLGIGLAGVYSWSLGYLYVLSAILFGAVIFYFKVNSKRTVICLTMLFFLLGMVRFIQDDWLPLTDSSNFIGQKVFLTGKIAEVPKVTQLIGEKKIRYVVAVDKLQTTGQLFKSSGKIIVTARQGTDKPAGSYDDYVQITGELAGLHGYNNPGAIDTVAALNRQGITARMNISGDSLHVVPGTETAGKKLLVQWRSQLNEFFLQTMAYGDAAILNGVLFGGGYDNIDAQVLRDFSATGIIHILSVSGSHIALVAAVMLWLGESCRLDSKITAVLAAGVIVFYACLACLAGLSPPVIRSAIMGIIGLSALVLGRDKYGPSSLAVAALVILAWQPALLYDISFQLSFGATAGLVFLYTKTVQKLDFLPRWLAAAIAVTIAAQAGIIPFLAWYFHSFSITSFIANIIVVPVIELIIIIGLLACVSGLVLPLAAKILLVLCSLGIGVAVQLNKALAAIDSLQVYLPPIGLAAGLMYYTLLAWCYGYLPSCLQAPSYIIKRWPYRSIAVLLATCLLLTSWVWFPKPVAVHFIDVGQGDATFIITPHGRAVLIDTGGTAGESVNFDVGERVVAPYIKHQGITMLDYLILTHGHQDHAGGAAAVAAAIPVKNIIVAPETFSDSLRALLRAKGNGVVIPAERGQIIELDGVTLEVVHAGVQVRSGQSGNESSSVIRVTYGQHSFLITGDLEGKQEAELIANGLKPCTVLKVAHHGSKTSTTDAFLHKAEPRYAVISVGDHNRFGHPHAAVLDKLVRTCMHVYRTDQDGAILMKTDGTDLLVEPYLH